MRTAIVLLSFLDFLAFRYEFWPYRFNNANAFRGKIAAKDTVKFHAGDIFFISDPKSFVSWLVCWATMAKDPPISHTGMITGPNEVLHAVVKGVVREKLSDQTSSQSFLLVVTQVVDDPAQSIARLEKRLGHKYDYVGAGILGLNCLLGVKGPHWLFCIDMLIVSSSIGALFTGSLINSANISILTILISLNVYFSVRRRKT